MGLSKRASACLNAPEMDGEEDLASVLAYPESDDGIESFDDYVDDPLSECSSILSMRQSETASFMTSGADV